LINDDEKKYKEAGSAETRPACRGIAGALAERKLGRRLAKATAVPQCWVSANRLCSRKANALKNPGGLGAEPPRVPHKKETLKFRFSNNQNKKMEIS